MPAALTVRASAHIEASPERVYAIIADYRNGHPHILPKQFRNLSVEQGGVGAGTIIRSSSPRMVKRSAAARS